jgi:hypothetical protein
MPSGTVPQTNPARERAIASIEHAYRSMGQSGPEPRREEPTRDEPSVEIFESDAVAPEPASGTTEAFKRSWPGKGVGRISAGLLAACVGVSLAVWLSSRGSVEGEPVSTSSILLNEKTATSVAPKNGNMTATTVAQAAPQGAPAVPMAGSPAGELAQQIERIARAITQVEQGIDQLKDQQSQLARENAELTEQLKATRDIARHGADLAEQLTATQAQLARDNANLGEQLKADRDVMDSIVGQLKQNQDQVAHLIAPEQKQRPRIVPARAPVLSQATVNPTQRPVRAPAASSAGHTAVPTSQQP